MGMPNKETEDYKREMEGLADVCRSLANKYCLRPYQTVVEIVGLLAPPYEGPIEFRNSNGGLAAYVSVTPHVEHTGTWPKLTGIGEVTLSLYKNKITDHQQFAADFRVAYEKHNSAPVNVEEATKKPIYHGRAYKVTRKSL